MRGPLLFILILSFFRLRHRPHQDHQAWSRSFTTGSTSYMLFLTGLCSRLQTHLSVPVCPPFHVCYEECVLSLSDSNERIYRSRSGSCANQRGLLTGSVIPSPTTASSCWRPTLPTISRVSTCASCWLARSTCWVPLWLIAS